MNRFTYGFWNVGNFGSWRAKTSDHGIHDLGWEDNGLFYHVTPFDDILLNECDVFDLEFETKLASCNYDAICLLQKFIKVC